MFSESGQPLGKWAGEEPTQARCRLQQEQPDPAHNQRHCEFSILQESPGKRASRNQRITQQVEPGGLGKQERGALQPIGALNGVNNIGDLKLADGHLPLPLADAIALLAVVGIVE